MKILIKVMKLSKVWNSKNKWICVYNRDGAYLNKLLKIKIGLIMKFSIDLEKPILSK